LPDSPHDACDFDAVANRDGSLRQDDETADEIAGDILKAESDTDANRTSENRQCGEMDPSVLQNKKNADYQHDVAHDLRNGVLQRPIEAAVRKEPVEKKTLRAGGKPKHRYQQPDQQENLNEAQVDCRKRRGPSQRNSRGIYPGDSEKDNHRETQDGCDDRDEVCVNLEPAEETPNDVALQKPRSDYSSREKPDEGDQSKERYVPLANVKQWLLQKRHVHVLV
jgi:hypothetical protein